MHQPLNPDLYAGLQAALGPVNIVNPGQPIRLDYVPDWVYRRGRLRVAILEYGETHKANCPFCSDTRQRLHVNHHWAVEDERTGDNMFHLVKCFNEDCLCTGEAQRGLHDLVYPGGVSPRRLKAMLPAKPAGPCQGATTIVLPKGKPLSTLYEDHPAVEYLCRRNFDPALLEQTWSVYYCPPSEAIVNNVSRPTVCSTRLVCPVYAPRVRLFNDETAFADEPLLVGWQARSLTDVPSTGAPKYLTAAGMKKTELLYDLPRAIDSEGPIVVVEGVTDVWRLASNAVALFGKSISTAQCQLLLRHFTGRPIVVLLDRDAEAEARFAVQKIRSSRVAMGDGSPVVMVKVPAHRKDPGECTHAEVWAAVRGAVEVGESAAAPRVERRSRKPRREA